MINAYWAKKSDERVTEAIAPLARVTADIKTEVRSVGGRVWRKRKKSM